MLAKYQKMFSACREMTESVAAKEQQVDHDYVVLGSGHRDAAHDIKVALAVWNSSKDHFVL